VLELELNQPECARYVNCLSGKATMPCTPGADSARFLSLTAAKKDSQFSLGFPEQKSKSCVRLKSYKWSYQIRGIDIPARENFNLSLL